MYLMMLALLEQRILIHSLRYGSLEGYYANDTVVRLAFHGGVRFANCRPSTIILQ